MLSSNRTPYWLPIILSSIVLLITMGVRQTTGLYVSPINTTSQLGIIDISLALAIAQFTWGAVQPIAGVLADKWGERPVLFAGIGLFIAGQLLSPFLVSKWGIILTFGLLTAAGTGICGFSLLLGLAAKRLPAEKRGLASGIINSGGSMGQFVFAPMVQKFIQLSGWMNSLLYTAYISLILLPIIHWLTPKETKPAQTLETTIPNTPLPPPQSLSKTVREALGNYSYWLLHLGFFTCGFHIAFLVTHLPTEIELCGLTTGVASLSIAIIGLANIIGSILAGYCTNFIPSKYILAIMYISRAVMVAIYLSAPKNELTFYIFAFALGLTWLATVPPTATIVGKLFGVKYLGTLFGLTLLSHQIGGFLGAYLGGLAIAYSGSYQWMWYADIALALLAGVTNFPIKEITLTPDRHQTATSS